MTSEALDRRAVITGIGVIAPTGVGAQAFWEAVLQGKSCIRRVTRFDPAAYPCQVAGEVADGSCDSLLDARKLKITTHASQLALAATELAMRDAKVANRKSLADAAVLIGTALGGLREAAKQYSILQERGARRVNPFIANSTPNYAPAAEVAAFLGASGPQWTLSTGCASSLQAIGQSASLIREGVTPLCITGGTESPITPLVFAGMGRSCELSTSNASPEQASRPFDEGHNGIVLSEGACILVVESLRSALERGALPYAELLGAASSCDALGIHAGDLSGSIGGRTIETLLQRWRINLAEVDYVCAHANSSPFFDRKEVAVLRRAFGGFLEDLPVSSIKGVLGHPFGASGAFQVATAAMAIKEGLVPPTHNFRTPDRACEIDCVPLVPRARNLRNVLVTSYGYGGINAYVALGSPPSIENGDAPLRNRGPWKGESLSSE